MTSRFLMQVLSNQGKLYSFLVLKDRIIPTFLAVPYVHNFSNNNNLTSSPSFSQRYDSCYKITLQIQFLSILDNMLKHNSIQLRIIITACILR